MMKTNHQILIQISSTGKQNAAERLLHENCIDIESVQRQKEALTAESNHWRDRNPAPILIGQRPCHKLLAKCLCVLEKGCVHMCMLELQGCVYVCVLDQWAGDSDRLVCSKHFLVSGSESSSSYGYNWGAHAHTQPTQAFTHACTHKPSLQTLMHIHTQAQYEHIL